MNPTFLINYLLDGLDDDDLPEEELPMLEPDDLEGAGELEVVDLVDEGELVVTDELDLVEGVELVVERVAGAELVVDRVAGAVFAVERVVGVVFVVERVVVRVVGAVVAVRVDEDEPVFADLVVATLSVLVLVFVDARPELFAGEVLF